MQLSSTLSMHRLQYWPLAPCYQTPNLDDRTVTGSLNQLESAALGCMAASPCTLLEPHPLLGFVSFWNLLNPMTMQVCTTLGMLTGEQAKDLAGAGLTAYNHNLDTSPEFYSTITSSRKYQVCPTPSPSIALCKSVDLLNL